jgi:hypothetical protein
MKSQLSSLLALAVATTTLAQFTVQSDPFQLILLSSNSTLNGSALYACHEGAAIEGASFSIQHPLIPSPIPLLPPPFSLIGPPSFI